MADGIFLIGYDIDVELAFRRRQVKDLEAGEAVRNHAQSRTFEHLAGAPVAAGSSRCQCSE